MTGPVLQLDPAEVQFTGLVGDLRTELARENGRRRLDGLPFPDGGSDVHNDRTSAAAEFAVAKLANRFWHAICADPSKALVRADVGESLHVKAITQRHRNLIVKPDDPRFGWYVLALVELPRVEILGCFRGDDVGDRHWCETLPVPAFLVPQRELLRRAEQ